VRPARTDEGHSPHRGDTTCSHHAESHDAPAAAPHDASRDAARHPHLSHPSGRCMGSVHNRARGSSRRSLTSSSSVSRPTHCVSVRHTDGQEPSPGPRPGDRHMAPDDEPGPAENRLRASRSTTRVRAAQPRRRTRRRAPKGRPAAPGNRRSESAARISRADAGRRPGCIPRAPAADWALATPVLADQGPLGRTSADADASPATCARTRAGTAASRTVSGAFLKQGSVSASAQPPAFSALRAVCAGVRGSARAASASAIALRR
jgi:hypothetical protein